jgi:hypothetical protein
MVRNAEQLTAAVKQRKVDAPGVDADAVEGAIQLPSIPAQPLLNFAPEVKGIPVETAVEPYRAVREAVQFAQLETLVRELA